MPPDEELALTLRRSLVALDCPNCGKRHRSVTVQQCVDRSMTEKTLQDRVVYRLKRDGWKVAHAGRAWVGDEAQGHWVTPMLPGWPDLTAMRAGHHILFIECKREQGDFQPGQVELLQLLLQTGNAAIVIRPSDLREGRVDVITRKGFPLG